VGTPPPGIVPIEPPFPGPPAPANPAPASRGAEVPRAAG
jgi:hypothetical protein